MPGSIRSTMPLALALFVLVGCASTPRVPHNVNVTRDAAAVKDCARLNEVVVASGKGGYAPDAGFDKNERALMWRTQASGGDTLLILRELRESHPGKAPIVRPGGATAPSAPYYVFNTFGEAYRCGAGPIVNERARRTPPPEPARGTAPPAGRPAGSDFGGTRPR